MGDQRFKPIGGMFQGVRGSTATGGEAQRQKLVKLNEQGVVDESCLSEQIARAATVSERLDREIQNRSEECSDLSDRIGNTLANVNRIYSELNAKISELETRLSGMATSQNA